MMKSTYFVQSCPTCGRRLEIRLAYLGRTVACAHCRGEFVAAEEHESEEPTPVPPPFSNGPRNSLTAHRPIERPPFRPEALAGEPNDRPQRCFGHSRYGPAPFTSNTATPRARHSR